ncbi:MFS general substrate transporter [Polyplosphaeria fusca]|uniref:MFS general substrate transporter n=1 Tax=Polyplosphaeria fusca TaxID=682080 RepID=A0A9P4V8N4_9PLEO|nr:MFS general substrate transporter [Polyplosphaeria fusca]
MSGGNEGGPGCTSVSLRRALSLTPVSLWLSLFMSAMDTTIITTALVKVSSSFNALDQSAWLVTSYLLTYNAFLMITAKFSDVWGVRSVMIGSSVFFLIFSMAAGGAKTMSQLIIFRALQGLGGSGMYSLTFVTLMKMITPEKLGFYSGVISSVFALANLLGPVLGGVITDNTSWRWIFWINGPIVGTGIAVLFFSMPGLVADRTHRERLRGFDIIGGVLSVLWPIPLIFALQEGGVRHAWSSGPIVGTLVAGVILLLAFGLYEGWLTSRTKMDAIFPIRFIKNPRMSLLLLGMFLLGFPFYVTFIQLPQRFQAVNNKSAERSGILLLPLSLLTPVGAMLAGTLIGKWIAAEFVLMIATAIITISFGLLSSLPTSTTLPVAAYGYEILAGFSLGFATAPYYFLLATSIDEKDIPVGTGAMNMLRTLGGAVAVAICSALHHSTLRKRLPEFLSSTQVSDMEESIAALTRLSPSVREKVGVVFGESYNRQFQVMLAFTGLNLLVVIVLGIVEPDESVESGILKAGIQPNEVERVKKANTNSAEKDVISSTPADDAKLP